jgi:hypothetical protein
MDQGVEGGDERLDVPAAVLGDDKRGGRAGDVPPRDVTHTFRLYGTTLGCYLPMPG